MKLTRKETLEIAHSVACWIIYEVVTGGFRTKGFERVAFLPWYFHNREHDLGGFCWIASVITVHVLRARGYSAGVAVGRRGGHGFAITACGMAIDPTVMQFGESVPRVRRRTKSDNECWGTSLDTLYRWRGHPTNPGEQKRAIRRICRRMGAVIK